MGKHHNLLKAGREAAWAADLMDLAWSYRASRLIQACQGAGVFARLARGAAPSADLAADLGLDAPMLDKCLIACCALGLVERSGPAWALSRRGRATLDPQSPFYQGNAVAHMANVWDFWNDLEHILRGHSGAGTFVADAVRTRSHRDFVLAMHNIAVAGRAAHLARCVSLPGSGMLTDVGGGPGTYSIALCQKYRRLRATVIDLPETLAITREVLDRFGMAGRIATVPGNWDKDEFGSDNDALMLSQVLHGPRDSADMKLSKAFRSMKGGAVLIVQDFCLNRGRTGPLLPALFNIMVGAFAIDELTGHIRRAGFVQLRQHRCPARWGVTLLTARKPL